MTKYSSQKNIKIKFEYLNYCSDSQNPVGQMNNKIPVKNSNHIIIKNHK